MDIEDLKHILRVKSKSFDVDIQEIIDTVQTDLINAGISTKKAHSTDPMIRRAIITYGKAEMGLDNPNREKLLISYENIKNKLSLMEEYTNEL